MQTAPPPPGFGRWPWWTPFVALAAALALMVGPYFLLKSADFPFRATLGEGLLGALLLGSAWLLMKRFTGRPWPADLGLRATPSRAAVGWVLVARVSVGFLTGIYVTVVGHVTSNVPTRPIGGDVDALAAVDTVIAVVVLAPVLEELFFRGFMYAALRGKLPVFWSALISGGLFGAIHPLFGAAAWNLVPVLALAGMAMALLYERTGSLWPAIAFHATMNAAIIWLVTGDALIVLYLIGGVALLFLLAPWRWFKRSGLPAGVPPPPPPPPPPAPPAQRPPVAHPVAN